MDSVVHFEIPADDPARAKKFYESVFGWKIELFPGETPYWIVHTVAVDEKTRMPKEVGAINGGLFKREAAEKPVVVISVASIDAHLKKIQKAGGKTTVPKMPIGEMGFYARVTDPEGNEIGIFEPNMKMKK